MKKVSILSLTFKEVEEFVIQNQLPKYRAKQIYEGLYQQGAQTFEDIKGLSRDLKILLNQHYFIDSLEHEAFVSEDGTIKYAIALSDKSSIECVWMPSEDRNSLCISSQAGCAMKCAFCVTGSKGLKRNLTAGEIVAQVRFIKSVKKHPLSNIVYMGMGEPLANIAEVIKSIKVITDVEGLAVGKRKITVSTVGLAHKIEEFFEATDVKLAISLTGSTNADRNHWMPINKTFDLEKLKSTLKKLYMAPGRQFTFEVVLIKDQTDKLEDAQHLAEFLQGLPAKVNLIPYNENPVFPTLLSPSSGHVQRYQDVLKKAGVHSTVRKNRGRDIMGACGQLAGNYEPTNLF